MEKKAILVGASGSIGSSLLLQLLACKHYANVLILVRRELRMQHPKLKQLVLDFDRLNDYAAEIRGEVVFSCLGTTRKQTPDQAQYRKIDYQYPLEIARIAQKNGAQSFHLVSSIGANEHSSVFYTRTKGEVESALKTVSFRNIHIYRPSLLDGARDQKRVLEGAINAAMSFINPLLFGKWKKYRSIKVEAVAKSMIMESLRDKSGIFIHESDEIERISRIEASDMAF